MRFIYLSLSPHILFQYTSSVGPVSLMLACEFLRLSMLSQTVHYMYN